MPKLYAVLGAINAAAAIALGAFGAHALKARLAPELLAVFHTGNQYHLYHALALVVVGGWMHATAAGGWLHAAAWLMMLGILLFSGSLYMLALSGVRAWGAVTPFGGAAFIAAWIVFAIAILRAPA